ncbi:MAG: hypothetical protein M1825_006087 [Sarcosagium campestre]|nr:MAG: hypothetical protein M1825_006087 [Sarcosagium campestre]
MSMQTHSPSQEGTCSGPQRQTVRSNAYGNNDDGIECDRTRYHSYVRDDIKDDTLLEAQLYLLAFATGIQDAASFPDFHCFASNQTGNTVLLAVGVFGISGGTFSTVTIGVSLALFVAAVVIAGQAGNVFGVRKRWWLLISSLIQTAMVFAAAALQYQYGVSQDGALAQVTIALLAFASGAQVAMVRSLKVTDITTAMATAAYIDLFIDPSVLDIHNGKRNRRLLFLLSLIAGSFAGAGAYKSRNSAFALLVSAIGKLIVTLTLLCNRAENVGRNTSS